MGTFKSLTNILIDYFTDSENAINEVTHGDINQVDLTQHTNFPLAHIIYTVTGYQDGFNTYNYQILLLDTYYDNLEDRLDVLDAMSEVATQFVSACNNGSIFNQQVQVSAIPTGDIMYDQLQNRLYGISLNIVLLVPSGLINCG
jgi:hypothetical protein